MDVIFIFEMLLCPTFVTLPVIVEITYLSPCVSWTIPERIPKGGFFLFITSLFVPILCNYIKCDSSITWRHVFIRQFLEIIFDVKCDALVDNEGHRNSLKNN